MVQALWWWALAQGVAGVLALFQLDEVFPEMKFVGTGFVAFTTVGAVLFTLWMAAVLEALQDSTNGSTETFRGGTRPGDPSPSDPGWRAGR